MPNNICDKCVEENGKDTKNPLFCNYCFAKIGCWDHESTHMDVWKHEDTCDKKEEAMVQRKKDPMGRFIQFLAAMKREGGMDQEEFDETKSAILDTFKQSPKYLREINLNRCVEESV